MTTSSPRRDHPHARLFLALARALVRLYPAHWRRRYADELLDLLLRRPPTRGDITDLAGHLLYTHLHPDLALTGDEPYSERLDFLMRTLRSSEIIIFCSFVLMVIADFQFGGLVDGGPYAPLVGAGLSWPIIQFEPGNALSLTMAVQSAGLDLAFLAVLAGGLPLAIAAWRRSPRIRRLFLLPLAGFVLAILPLPIAFLLRGPVATINLTFETPITITYLCWFVLLAAVSVWAIVRAIVESDVPDRLFRFAVVPGVLAAVGLLVMLGATVAFGVIAHIQVPQLFDHSDASKGYVTLVTWAIDVALMAAAVLMALVAVVRGISFPTNLTSGHVSTETA
jgi:hypothetical protein